MRPQQTRVQASPSHFAARAAASIDEFFEDHMSDSEVLLDEMEEAWIMRQEREPEEEFQEEPERWLTHLYDRGIRPRI
jgi:hypothetical protein